MKRELRQKIKISENMVIKVIGDYLQIQRNQGKLMYIRNNSGAMPIMDGKNKRRYIRFGDKGSPDFLVWKPSEKWAYEADMGVDYLRSIAIEAKSDIGKQSADQIKWQKEFEAMGGEYCLIRNLDSLVKIIG